MSKELESLVNQFKKARNKFEFDVAEASLKATQLAKNISGAIGEVSIIEAKQAIIREFASKLGITVTLGEEKE